MLSLCTYHKPHLNTQLVHLQIWVTCPLNTKVLKVTCGCPMDYYNLTGPLHQKMRNNGTTQNLVFDFWHRYWYVCKLPRHVCCHCRCWCCCWCRFVCSPLGEVGFSTLAPWQWSSSQRFRSLSWLYYRALTWNAEPSKPGRLSSPNHFKPYVSGRYQIRSSWYAAQSSTSYNSYIVPFCFSSPMTRWLYIYIYKYMYVWL